MRLDGGIGGQGGLQKQRQRKTQTSGGVRGAVSLRLPPCAMSTRTHLSASPSKRGVAATLIPNLKQYRQRGSQTNNLSPRPPNP